MPSEVRFSGTLSEPYQYLRVEDHPRHQYVIFGGEDHKTGQADDTQSRFDKLERLLTAYVPRTEVKHRWSGQVVETNDGLPLIGEISDRQFVSTGYAGNGMIHLGIVSGTDHGGTPRPGEQIPGERSSTSAERSLSAAPGITSRKTSIIHTT